MDNLNNSSNLRKRIRQNSSPLNSPKTKKRGFWIDQLLEDKFINSSKQSNNLKELTSLKRNGKKEGKIKDNFPERKILLKLEEESPPLDDYNWLPSRQNNSSLNNLKCELENKEIWKQFDQLGTEMIITKSGRRMFPVLRCRLQGTLPGFVYLIYLDLIPVEKKHRFRYAYNKSQWQSAGKAERAQFGRLFSHPDNPIGGDQLAQNGQIISFDKVKLTNNAESNSTDQLQLNSMHKYRPRVHVVCIPKEHSTIIKKQQQIFNKEIKNVEGLKKLANGPFDYKTFLFEGTTFVAVTAYQNQLVTQKKIELNPFAKGFRDQKNEDMTDERAANCFLIEPSITNNSNSISSKNTPQKNNRLFPSAQYLASPPFRSSPFSMLSSIGLRFLPNWSSNTQIALNPFFRVTEEKKKQNNSSTIQDSNSPLIKNLNNSNQS